MALKHDEMGFLVGDPINIDKVVATWNEIRNDVRAIRLALAGLQTGKVQQNRLAHASPATPKHRTSVTTGLRENISSASEAIPRSITKIDSLIIDKSVLPLQILGNRASATPKQRKSAQQNIARERDSSGRFVKKTDNDSNIPIGNTKLTENVAGDSVIRTAADKIINAVGEAGGGMEETDPAIKSFNEIAQPLARGYETILGGDREQHRKESWFKRIFGELKLFRKEESIFNKAASRSLKNIEENPVEISNGDNSSTLRRFILPLLTASIAFMGGSLSGLGDRIYQSFIETWEDFKSLPDKIIDTISNTFGNIWTGINEFFKEKFGIDIEAKLKPAVDAGKKVVNAVTEKVRPIMEPVSNVAKRAYEVAEATTGSVLESVMPKGYRHRASFDGVEGGDNLARYGTYTDAEAQRIRALKRSAANTSANMKGGMPVEIQEKIAQQARMHGLDPAMMLKFAAMESGGNPNAISKTGAIGLFQLTGQTASGLGVKNRFDVDENIKGAVVLTKQNAANLKKSGLPVTEENLYMMFQLGPKSAKEIIEGAAKGKSKNELSSRAQKSMNLNFGANSKTASDYIATNSRALNDRYSKVVTVSSDSVSRLKDVSIADASLPVQTVSIPMPQSPRTPQITSAIAEAPPVITPLAGGNDKRTTVIASIQQDVGQDVKDRRIANIVTGGLSGN